MYGIRCKYELQVLLGVDTVVTDLLLEELGVIIYLMIIQLTYYTHPKKFPKATVYYKTVTTSLPDTFNTLETHPIVARQLYYPHGDGITNIFPFPDLSPAPA